MVEPVRLATVPASAEVQQHVVELLERTLADAKSGKIEQLFMIVVQPNGDWQERAAATLNKSELVGKLFTAVVGYSQAPNE